MVDDYEANLSDPTHEAETMRELHQLFVQPLGTLVAHSQAALFRMSEYAQLGPSWKGLDIRMIEKEHRFRVMMLLALGKPSQEIVNFCALSDVVKSELALHAKFDAALQWMSVDDFTEEMYQHEIYAATEGAYSMTDEQVALTRSFWSAMVAAASENPRPPLGAFILARPDMPYLDGLLDYDYLRIFIKSTEGMFISVVKGRSYWPFYWTPEYHTAWTMGYNIAMAVDALAACIWRDACVIHEKAFSERQRGAYQSHAKPDRIRARKLVLPRVIRSVDWSPSEHREIRERRSHGVRGHYRLLLKGQQASEEAVSNALLYGYAEPPEGYTFVIPHLRGQGDAPEIPTTEIVCRGLVTAHTMFSSLDVRN